MQSISVKKALKLQNTIFIDTRSPIEFELDHIPNALNIPIFDNQERKVIGTLYKENQKHALDWGIQRYSEKLPHLTDHFKKLDKNKTIIIYCWRGGLRSQTITKLVESLGYNALLLEKGYKGYRAFIRESLYNYPIKFKFIVLWGNTGTAKTKIIQKLKPSIDLEGLAQHRSSLFGAVGLIPRTQKYFETLLFFELERLAKEKFVFVEGESRKIGNIIVPESIYNEIKNGINIKVNASIDSRAKITVSEYMKPEYIEKIKEIIPHLKKRLSNKQIENLLALMDKKDYSQVAEILLTQYYDPLYENTLDKIEYQHSISSDDINACIKELKEIKNKLL